MNRRRRERGARTGHTSRVTRGARAVTFGAAALLATIAACGSSNQPTGSLYVTVVDKSNAPAADVVVTTEPATESRATDALGSVFFAKVPAGGYAVTGTHPIAGSGRTTARVVAGEVAEATIVLGGDDGSGGGAAVAGGGGGRWRRSDGRRRRGERRRWRHGGRAGRRDGRRNGRDGWCGGGTTGRGGTGGRRDRRRRRNRRHGRPRRNGRHAAGSGGTGGSGAGQRGTAAPSATVVLAALTKDSNGVNLSWTPTPGNAFATYRIYRGSSTAALAVINIVQDGAAVQYRDESGLLGVAYTYRVGGVTAGGQEVQSNTQTITTGVYIDVGSQIEAMMVDPTRPYLYGVDRVNNSLHFINLTTQHRREDRSSSGRRRSTWTSTCRARRCTSRTSAAPRSRSSISPPAR